jgi:uncharacterized protein YbjT (DUF2867 family)
VEQAKDITMKFVVIGGTGLIGSKTVAKLRQAGHEAVAASPSTGVDIVTGAGLDAAFAGADVVIDLANSPSFEKEAAMAFFETSGRNIFAAERRAGIGHHVALSVVGTSRLQAMGYFEAKQHQEDAIRASGIQYTIIHATQFFEFAGAIAGAGAREDGIHLSSAAFQPISADDVAHFVAEIAARSPLNRVIEIAGPERAPLNDFISRFLTKAGDTRPLVVGASEPYFGLVLDDGSLVPGEGALIGPTRFEDYLAREKSRP